MIDMVDTALNVTVVGAAGFAARPPVQTMTAVPVAIPPVPTVTDNTSATAPETPELTLVALPLIAVGAALMPHDVSSTEAFAQIAEEEVITMVWLEASALVMPIVKVIADAMSPVK